METSQEKVPVTQHPPESEILPGKSLKLNQVESQLQSLGFVIKNGEARFKLDESTCPSTGEDIDFSLIDADDTLSFVVLGKSSLDSIQASSMASYVDIQQKSMSVDYDSIISSMNTSEIHQKLLDLLQENEKLKETLKQNNSAMKQQISSMAIWQEEIVKVYQNHKKNFTEAAELIKYLKKENSQLKIKLSMETLQNPDTGFNFIEVAECREKQEDEQKPGINLQDKLSSVLDDVHEPKCEKLSSDIEKFIILSNLFNPQFSMPSSSVQEEKTSFKEPESNIVEAELTNALETKSFREESLKDKILLESSEEERKTEMEKSKESITEVEHKPERATSWILSCIKNPLDVKKFHQQRIGVMKEHIERLHEVNRFFDIQLNRADNIAKYLKQSIDIMDLLLGTLSTKPELLDVAALQVQKDQLSTCYQMVFLEQMKLNDERQTAFESRERFQKILSEHEVTLNEFETLMDSEDTSGSKVNSTSEEIVCEKKKTQKKTEEQVLTQQQGSLEEQQKILNDDKKSLEAEYKNLNEAREQLQQIMQNLNEEKTSLDQQSQLYESFKKTLQMEKNALEIKCTLLSGETEELKAAQQKKDEEFKKLQDEMKEQREIIDVLKLKMQADAEDFIQERKVKDALLADYNKVVADLENQMEFSKKLQKKIEELQGGNKSGSSTPQQPELRTIACPCCEYTFGSSTDLQRHVGHCLAWD